MSGFQTHFFLCFRTVSGMSQYPVWSFLGYLTISCFPCECMCYRPSLPKDIFVLLKTATKSLMKTSGLCCEMFGFLFFFNSKSNFKTSEKSCYFFDKKQISFKQCVHFWEFVNPRRLFIIFANYFRHSVFSTLGKACLSALRQLEKHLVQFYLLS